ncbi:MAG: hypothetical protein JXR37_37460 [Kiritimatiellae bacterium]|nr:hypothetical protein [Kiritimatiellia bacterium]
MRKWMLIFLGAAVWAEAAVESEFRTWFYQGGPPQGVRAKLVSVTGQFVKLSDDAGRNHLISRSFLSKEDAAFVHSALSKNPQEARDLSRPAAVAQHTEKPETIQPMRQVNPTMGELHELLVPAGWLVGKYLDNLAWKRGDEAVYFEVEGTGNGQIHRRVTLLEKYEDGKRIWSARQIRVVGEQIQIVRGAESWKAVLRGKRRTPPDARIDSEVHSSSGIENTRAYRNAERTLNDVIGNVERRGYSEEALREGSSRLDDAIDDVKIEMGRKINRKPEQPGYSIEARQRAAINALMAMGDSREEAEATVKAMTDLGLLPDPPQQ